MLSCPMGLSSDVHLLHDRTRELCNELLALNLPDSDSLSYLSRCREISTSIHAWYHLLSKMSSEDVAVYSQRSIKIEKEVFKELTQIYFAIHQPYEETYECSEEEGEEDYQMRLFKLSKNFWLEEARQRKNALLYIKLKKLFTQVEDFFSSKNA